MGKNGARGRYGVGEKVKEEKGRMEGGRERKEGRRERMGQKERRGEEGNDRKRQKRVGMNTHFLLRRTHCRHDPIVGMGCQHFWGVLPCNCLPGIMLVYSFCCNKMSYPSCLRICCLKISVPSGW